MTPDELLARVNNPNTPGPKWGYDPAKGLYFVQDSPGSPRRYQASGPDGSTQAAKPGGGGGLVHGDYEWDTREGKWKQHIDAGKVGSWAAGAGIGVGALNAAGVPSFGFGSGGGATPASGTYIPGAEAGLPPSLAAENAHGIMSPGQYLGSVKPNTGGGGTTPPAGGLLDTLKSTKGIASLASLIPLLLSNRGGGGNPLNDLLSQNPQISSLMDMSVQRAQRTDPLHQAVTQLAMSRMPTNMQR